VLLDFAERAFEFDIKLSVVALRPGPLVGILNGLGVDARVGRAGSREPGAEKADVIYAVSPRAQRAVLLRREPHVWHQHRYPKFWYSRILARLKPRALIFNSAHVAQAWGFSGSRRPAPGPQGATVISNGVDLDRFHPRPRTGWLHQQLGLPRSARLIGMPTVFERWKGHTEVMAAFQAITSEFPDVHLVIVGGPMYATKEEITTDGALRRAVKEQVFFTGFVPKIEQVYPELDLVVHYSLKPEPFGRPVLEAMACAVPVIAADEGGPADILRSGTTGWLTEPRNVGALTRTLRAALGASPERRAEMGKAGRLAAEDGYSAREFARRVAAVLWGVVS
jgi:glycosyltransferase involved in cell wall biosynthesis